MRLIVCFILVLIGVNVNSQNEINVRIDGFAGLTFGMPKDEAIKKVQPKREKDISHEVDTNDGYIVTNFHFGGILFDRCYLHFYNDALYAGIFNNEFATMEQSSGLYDNLYTILTDKYGTPQYKKDLLVVWKGEDEKAIALSVYEHEGMILVQLSYIDRVVANTKAAEEKNEF